MANQMKSDIENLQTSLLLPAKRPIKSFEAETDVNRMLDRALADGFTLKSVCNKSLRKFLISKGYARKKDITAQKEVA